MLLVVGWHVYRLTAPSIDSHHVPVALWPLGTARLGVDVFFVLSGFLVVRSWQSLRAKSSAPRAYWEYARRRVTRILPAYWVSLAVLVPLLAPILWHQPRRLALFISVNQYVRFWLPERVNVVYWSLTTEWHFYLLVPLIAWLLVRVGRWPVYAACLTISLLWWSHVPPMQLPQGFVFGRLDQFVIGAIAAELVAAHATERSRIVSFVHRRGVLCAIVLGLLLLGSYHGSTLAVSRRNGFDPFMHPLFALLVAGVVLHLATRDRSVWLAHPVLRWFGMISFSLYLWHYPILSHVLAWTNGGRPMPAVLWRPIAVAMAFALAVGVAVVSYHLVERPFARLGRPSDADKPAGRMPSWPSRRSSASRPSTASRCAVRPIPTPSSRLRS